MPKLPILKPKEMARMLERAGYCFIRQKGSQRLYRKNNINITIPWHSKDLRNGTIRKIISYSGLSVEEFLQLKK